VQSAALQFLHLLSGVRRERGSRGRARFALPVPLRHPKGRGGAGRRDCSSMVSASLSLIPSVPVYRRDSRDPAHVKVVSRTAIA
jgi:hypothetical protein